MGPFGKAFLEEVWGGQQENFSDYLSSDMHPKTAFLFSNAMKLGARLLIERLEKENTLIMEHYDPLDYRWQEKVNFNLGHVLHINNVKQYVLDEEVYHYLSYFFDDLKNPHFYKNESKMEYYGYLQLITFGMDRRYCFTQWLVNQFKIKQEQERLGQSLPQTSFKQSNQRL